VSDQYEVERSFDTFIGSVCAAALDNEEEIGGIGLNVFEQAIAVEVAVAHEHRYFKSCCQVAGVLQRESIRINMHN
jgi:hypothetical protein